MSLWTEETHERALARYLPCDTDFDEPWYDVEDRTTVWIGLGLLALFAAGWHYAPAVVAWFGRLL